MHQFLACISSVIMEKILKSWHNQNTVPLRSSPVNLRICKALLGLSLLSFVSNTDYYHCWNVVPDLGVCASPYSSSCSLLSWFSTSSPSVAPYLTIWCSTLWTKSSTISFELHFASKGAPKDFAVSNNKSVVRRPIFYQPLSLYHQKSAVHGKSAVGNYRYNCIKWPLSKTVYIPNKAEPSESSRPCEIYTGSCAGDWEIIKDFWICVRW